jgi:orotidine-5'-phosphate decarboxylase
MPGERVAELIVALDFDSMDEALRLVDSLPRLRWAKVGPMLFLDGGPAAIEALKSRGVRVFLDLKWHDIPSSVAGAVSAASRMGVDLATVHSLGGPDMIAAARDASGEMKLVAVTVLTSHTADQFLRLVGRPSAVDLRDEAARLARMAVSAGAHGVVSSPHEISAVRDATGPDAWIVVPGIRPAGAAVGDQLRTAEPGAAAVAGATHLVVGRPITRAKNPAKVYDSISREIEVSR